jgi:phosphatidylglycerophosphate synthase
VEPLREFLIFTSSGFGVVFFLLLLPPRLLRAAARIKGLSPNWVTVYGVPLTWLGILIYFHNHEFLGFLLVTFALTLDRIDGKMATLGETFVPPQPLPQDPVEKRRLLWREFNHPGSTEIGKWLDPLSDKLKLPIPIVYLGIVGHFFLPLTIAVLLVDFISTIMRPPFQLIPERMLRGTSATAFGKLKVTFQFTALIFVLLLDQAWLVVPEWTANLALSLALLFAILSVLSRFTLSVKGGVLGKLTDRISKYFKHDR